MAYTATDLEAVRAAILDLATGRRVTSITFSSGKVLQYGPASLSDLRSLEASISRQIGTGPKQTRISTSKGL